MNTVRDATVPTIDTGRLILRGHREEDLAAQAATMADPSVVRYLGGTPFNREDSWRRILMARGRDAADVPLSTTFGPNTLANFKVWTDEVTAPPR